MARLEAADPESPTVPARRWIWIGAALMWIGAIGLYARGPAKHLTRELRALRESYRDSENAVRLQNQQDTEASEGT